MEKELREKIKEKPLDPMNYYYLGKGLMKKPLANIDSIKEIESLFRQSLELAPNLWAPRAMLGELLYKQDKFKEAERCFRDLIARFPNSVSAKEYLSRCITLSSAKKEDKASQKDSLCLFENNLRDFIRTILKNGYGEEWWRKGIPKKVRAKCAARREEGLEEEKEAELLLFADFYDYKEIIEYNKKFFTSCIDTREWGNKLEAIEPIRNAIAHNRPLPQSVSKIKNCYEDFQKVMEKVSVAEKES